MTKKKIVFVYPKPIIGGSTTSLLGLLETFNYDENDVTLLFFDKSGPLLKAFQQIQGLKIVELGCEKSVSKKKRTNPLVWVVKVFAVILRLISGKKNSEAQIMSYCNNIFRKKIDDTQFDIAVAFLESDTSIYVAKKVRARKKISWMHVDYISAGFIASFDKKMYKSFDYIVTVSEECKNSFVNAFNCYKQKVVYIPNILSYRYVKTLMDDGQTNETLDFDGLKIVTTCRIDLNHKGLDRAIEALGQINKQTALKFKWYIIGNGPDFEKANQMVKKFYLEKYVIFLGQKTNPFPYYKNADLFFLPSRYEGRPMAVDEALLCGVPCAVTNYSSAKEQIINGLNGFIIDNSFDAIYNFLNEINRGEIDLLKLKKGALSSHYSNEETIKKIRGLLDD